MLHPGMTFIYLSAFGAYMDATVGPESCSALTLPSHNDDKPERDGVVLPETTSGEILSVCFFFFRP
jgi:hypothetical protein